MQAHAQSFYQITVRIVNNNNTKTRSFKITNDEITYFAHATLRSLYPSTAGILKRGHPKIIHIL